MSLTNYFFNDFAPFDRFFDEAFNIHSNRQLRSQNQVVDTFRPR